MSRKVKFNRSMHWVKWSLILGCSSSYLPVMAQQDTDEIVNNLIQLRGQVEDLQAEMQILKAEHTQSMSYLNTRKTELEANIDRKQLQIKQAQAEVVNLQENIKSLGLDSEQMIPDVLQMAEQIKTVIDSGIPFKYKERSSVIEDIMRDLEGRKVSAQGAINRLWAFLEDEMRLTRENAIYSQTINLAGEQVLVDVAKLGTVLMYFKTRDDRYGQAVNNGGTWQYQLLTDEKAAQSVATLFDSLKKQIRQGYFSLPLDLSSSK